MEIREKQTGLQRLCKRNIEACEYMLQKQSRKAHKAKKKEKSNKRSKARKTNLFSSW